MIKFSTQDVVNLENAIKSYEAEREKLRQAIGHALFLLDGNENPSLSANPRLDAEDALQRMYNDYGKEKVSLEAQAAVNPVTP